MYKYYCFFKHLSFLPCFQLSRLLTQLSDFANVITMLIREKRKCLCNPCVAVFQGSGLYLEAGSIGHQWRSGHRLALDSSIHFLLNLTAHLQVHTF